MEVSIPLYMTELNEFMSTTSSSNVNYCELLAKYIKSKQLSCSNILYWITIQITRDIAAISTNSEIVNLLKLINTYKVLRQTSGKTTSFIEKDKAKEIFMNLIEKTSNIQIEFIAIQSNIESHSSEKKTKELVDKQRIQNNQLNFLEKKIHAITSFIVEFYNLIPSELSQLLANSNILFKEMLDCFSNNYIVREFIYLYVNCNYDKSYLMFKDEIGRILLNVKDLLNAEKYDIIVNEMISIAKLFVQDFNSILTDFTDVINSFLLKYKPHKYDFNIQLLFSELFNLARKEIENNSFEIFNLMLRIYEEHLDNEEIGKAIIYHSFNQITTTLYQTLMEETNLVDKYIKQLHKQTNQEIVSYFLEWLKQLSFEPEVVESFVPNKEFELIIDLFPFFDDNIPMLLFIHKELKIILLQKEAYAKLFINQPKLFKVMKAIVDQKGPTAKHVLKFIEELFDLNLYQMIFDKANEVKLFSFDTFLFHDEIRYQVIKLSLFFENNEAIFANRTNDNIEGLGKLLSQLKDSDKEKHFDDNCEEIIEVLKIILDSFSQGKTDVYQRVETKVFDNILRFIDEFTIALIELEKQMRYIFRLWNILFKFISDLNKRLIVKKLQTEEEASQLINKSPEFITQLVIEKFISNGLSKYKNEKGKIFIRYLYEKCINSTLMDENFDPIDFIYDPIHCLKLKYPNSKEIEQKPKQEKETNNHSFIFIQSQLILKSMMNVILAIESSDIKLSFIDYLDYLCSISQFNGSLMLRSGIVKFLIDLLTSSLTKTEKIVSLLPKILAYASKSDLEYYFKQLYYQLIIKHDTNTATSLLSILHKSLQTAKKRNYVTLCKISTHHPMTYKFVYLNKTLTSSINIFISLYTESFGCLYNFTLCKISKADSSFSIELTKGKVHFLKNKSLQFSIPLNSQSKNLKNTWYNFLIEKGNNYAVNLEKTIFIITIPDIIDSEMMNEDEKEEQYLDFSMGFINIPESDNAENRINIETYYVDVSYLLLSKEAITSELIQVIEANEINSSKNGGIMQFKPKFSPNNIITEVLFSKIKLAKMKYLHSVRYKMTNQFNFDLTSTEVIIAIVCNDTRNHDNVLYLLKEWNLIDYASMNMICDLNAFSKSMLVSDLFPFFNSIEMTINDSYFADMFYILLSQTDNFIHLYKPIINIVLSHISFQKIFFGTYIHQLKMLFYFHSSGLMSDFSVLLTIQNIIPIQEDMQYDCIINIYLDPFLFTSLPLAVQKEFLKKMYLIVNNYNTADQVLDYTKIRKILKRFMNLMVFFELDCTILGEIKEIIEEILNVYSNSTAVELDKSITLVKTHLIIISNFTKNIKQISFTASLRQFDLEVIQLQIDVLESYLKSALSSKISSINNHEDIGYIAEYFKIEFKFFMKSLQFDKTNKLINKSLRLLWPEFFNDYRNYSWVLSDKEGYSRMRKKIVLKENDMAIKEAKTNKSEELSIIIEAYMRYWIWFERFSAYDSYSSTLLVHFLVHPKDKYQNSYFCLIFKNNEPIESLLIIGEKSIYIYYNIIIDRNKRVYLSKIKTSNVFWARDNNDKEWDSLFKSKETKQSILNEFNYQSFQIRFKSISFTQISELHKRRHLHQNNSIEVFTLKGSSYFITVFPKCRDELFNKILNNTNDQSLNSKIKNINKASNQNAIYLKHYPIIIASLKDKEKQDALMEKTVIDGKALVLDLSEKWAQYLLPNFNYLMLVNTVSGRSYNDLTQYFVFPWIIKNFFTECLDMNNDDLYRDFSFPLHAQCKEEREKKKKNYEIKLQDEKISKEYFEKKQAENKKSGVITKIQKYESLPIFHCGNYYSNFSFVCYFMLRLSPFSLIGLSVKGTFSQGDRLFNSYDNIASISKRFQEWIPELFYLPEMIVNINDYELGTTTTNKEKKEVNDIITPPWAYGDPRLVIFEFNRILEKEKVSDQLANWIDLVFGYKLIGKECIEAVNMFNEGCYPYEDLKEKKMTNEELSSKLDSTSNLGCCPIQLFSKPHIQRKAFNPGKLIPFYSKIAILLSIQPQKSIKTCSLKSRTIGDMKAINETSKYNISKGSGGLSSLSFNTDVFNEDSFDRDAKEKRNYLIVGKNKSLLGPKFSIVLSYSVSSIFITNPVNSVIFEFPLKEQSPISTVISSTDGKYIIAGLSNGNIIKLRKRTKHNEVLNFPFQEITKLKSSKMNVYPNHTQQLNPLIFYNYKDLSYKSCDYWESSPSPPSSKNPLKKSLKVYALFEESKSGIPSNSISKMDLCESYSFLLVIDKSNNVYQYDFNLLKLLYKYQFNSISNTQYPIKYAKIIPKTGEYLIGTKYSLHLFSINGLPISFLNMLDQELRNKYSITSFEAVALEDTYVFTGHSNGNLIVWKITTDAYLKKTDNDQPLFEAYHQRYRNSFKEKSYSNTFLQRKFEIKKICNKTKSKIIYIKLSDDLLRLYYIDEDMTILRLSSDDYFKDEDGRGLRKHYSVQYQNKIICKKCKKALPLTYDLGTCSVDEEICQCSNSLNNKFRTSDYDS